MDTTNETCKNTYLIDDLMETLDNWLDLYYYKDEVRKEITRILDRHGVDVV
jgi:hypothetical protein